MGLFSKKDKVEAAPAPAKKASGRPLLLYFVPSLLLAILLMAAFAFFAQQGLQRASAAMDLDMARNAAEAVATRVEGEVLARRDMLSAVVSHSAAAAALASGDRDEIARLQDDLQRRLPGLLQLRLLRRDASQPDPGGAAPFGYAGLDMVNRTIETGRPALAEVHQIKSGAPYVALATPVRVDDRVVGAYFAAWDIRPISHLVESSPRFNGRLRLVQGGAATVLAQGPGALESAFNDGQIDVPQTIWKVVYGLDDAASGLGNMLMMFVVIGAGGLVLLLASVLQWRALARDLRADMSTVVNLGEAILRREGAAQRKALLSGTHDAVTLLGQYVRDALKGPAAATAARATPATGVPQPGAGSYSGMSSGVEVEELRDHPDEALGGATGTRRPGIELAESLFRANDIRGVVGETLTSEVAEVLGLAVGSMVLEQGGTRVAVAHDVRPSSSELAGALIKGLTDTGCEVVNVGQAPTPLLYFALATQPVQAGVMVTGSHNPAEYNGFKIVIGDTALEGDALQALRKRMLEGPFKQGVGMVEDVDLVGDYTDAVTQAVQLARPLKVVVDAGNGVAGELAIATLEALGCEVVPLFCEPDGSFPNHHPDPSQPDNLASLILEVEAQQADIGISLDGDGDRLGVIDNNGQIVWADSLLMLLAADVLGRHPGVDVIYDVKSSRHLASFILSHGGRPIMWKAGHAMMRAKMVETGALLGGEFSGHLFIKERWYGFDDAVYATARVIEILALEQRSAAAVFAELPSSPATPEYQLMLEEGQSRDLMRALDAHKIFDDARLVELDGLRVEFPNGWGLIRPSNTLPALTFRFEADDEIALEGIKARFRELLQRVAPDMQAPF